MVFAYSITGHQLGRLPLSLEVAPHESERLTEICSPLFHQRLRTVIASVMDRVQQECGDLLLTESLTVDLGELPLAGFENHFCQGLEEQLLQTLLGYRERTTVPCSQPARDRFGVVEVAQRGEATLREESTSSPMLSLQSSGLTLFSHYLDNGFWPTIEYWSSPDTLDEWLLKHMAAPQKNWSAQLAIHCLTQSALRRLYRVLQPATLARLCQYLLPSQTFTEPVTLVTLMLCALRHFQQYPQHDIPDAWPVGAWAFEAEGHERLLVTLFYDYQAAFPALATWLRVLWGQPTTRRVLKRQWTPDDFHQLEQWLETVPVSQLETGRVSAPPEAAKETD